MYLKMKRYIIITLVALSWLPMAAQLTTGYYRVRNAAEGNDTYYITLANDKFSYQTVIVNACGGLSQALNDNGKQRAFSCAGAFLKTDIHLKEDPNCIDPASIIYIKNINNTKQHDLIAQTISLNALTQGEYKTSKTIFGITIPVTLTFSSIYAILEKKSGLYTAKVHLTDDDGLGDLGYRYFIDDNGTFAISESDDADNAKWIIEPVTSMNVEASLEYKGKYYCTMYTPFAYTLSSQDGVTMKAYVISAINADGTLQKTEVANNDSGTVPAGTPVILECSSNELTACKLIIPNVAPRTDTNSAYNGPNLLKGAYISNTDGNVPYTNNGNGTSYINANNYTSYDSSTMLVFGVSESPTGVSRLGFFPFTGDKMKSNKVWLEIPTSSTNTNFTFESDESNQKGVAYE